MDLKMDPAAVNPNLTNQTFSYKDILVGKLVRAVACSVTSQVTIIVLYIIIANINLYDPLEWLSSIVSTFTYLSTWIFVVIFSLITFGQCLICAKDYVLMSTYCSTRFQQFLHVFSLHNFLLLSLHVITGGAFTWQVLVIIDSTNKDLTVRCKPDRSCLVQDTFFLIVGGFFIGFYFFFKVYLSTKQLVFPVVQQRKFLQFRTSVSFLFKQSLGKSVWPTLYFSLFYYLWGENLEEKFADFANLDKANRESSVLVYLYLWWFAMLYYFSMNLMRFFFYLFLTESVQFPVIKENVYVLTLQEALAMNSLPIVQHLACLDLFLLSQWNPLRRQLFFTLSQPGGHPHNWNCLVESTIKLFSEYTDLLKKTMDAPVPSLKKPELTPFTPSLQSPPQSLKYRNLRNMSLHNDFLDVVDVTPPKVDNFQKVRETFNRIVNFLKTLLGINFLFGELPQVNIQKCLGNGQLIIWASQGIAELTTKSLVEDKYGIVQKDVPVIVTSLVQLKQSLEKLNKVPSLSRKVAALDDFNYKMKNAVNAAVKHSLFNICFHFGEYFKEFPLSGEVLQYLHSTVMLKNCN